MILDEITGEIFLFYNYMDLKDAKDVAFSIGCERASIKETLENLFDAKFSEALKTFFLRLSELGACFTLVMSLSWFIFCRPS